MRILSHEIYAHHEVQAGHPERPDRITHLMAYLRAEGLATERNLTTASAATAEDILRVHDGAYLGHLESQSPDSGLIALDPDTWLSPASLDAATYAAGAVCQGVDLLLSGEDRVFCAVRPPGHHAESDAAMGFSIYNSIAVGAAKALATSDVERVAILDFDVHHGNGTVEIFHDQPEVLVLSSFQHPFYPHRFFESDWSNIINTPLPAGTDGSGFRQAIERDWLPALNAHQPDLILVSAGFDAHAQDPLAGLNLVEEDFGWITELIVDQANTYAQGKVLSALEGGYDLDALATSVATHLNALSD